MTLLPDPRRKSPRESSDYILDPREAPYERETVLNQVIGSRRRLAPGQVVSGWFLAVGQAAIPSKYYKDDQFRFRLRFSLYDQRGRSQHGLFLVSVEKDSERKRQMEGISAAGKTRRKLIPDEDIQKAHGDEPSKVVSVIQEETLEATR
jgi:hypothetical protein